MSRIVSVLNLRGIVKCIDRVFPGILEQRARGAADLWWRHG
jgi:hypothetical protein